MPAAERHGETRWIGRDPSYGPYSTRKGADVDRAKEDGMARRMFISVSGRCGRKTVTGLRTDNESWNQRLLRGRVKIHPGDGTDTGSGRVRQPRVTLIAVRFEVNRSRLVYGNKRACTMSDFVRAVCGESRTHGSSGRKGREALPIPTNLWGKRDDLN